MTVFDQGNRRRDAVIAVLDQGDRVAGGDEVVGPDGSPTQATGEPNIRARSLRLGADIRARSSPPGDRDPTPGRQPHPRPPASPPAAGLGPGRQPHPPAASLGPGCRPHPRSAAARLSLSPCSASRTLCDFVATVRYGHSAAPNLAAVIVCGCDVIFGHVPSIQCGRDVAMGRFPPSEPFGSWARGAVGHLDRCGSRLSRPPPGRGPWCGNDLPPSGQPSSTC